MTSREASPTRRISMPHAMSQSGEDIISGILNWVCPECGGRMGGRTKEFKCQGECLTDWRDVWERRVGKPGKTDRRLKGRSTILHTLQADVRSSLRFLGDACHQLVQSRKQELQDGRLVRLSVAEDQIDSRRISLQGATRDRRREQVLRVSG